MIFSYAGTPGFFSIAAEMREPRHYTRSLVVCQTIITVVYITVGVVMYYYCGSYVASPAIGSAGPLLKKVGYGIGLPGLIASLLLLLHVRSPLITFKLQLTVRSYLPNSFSSAFSVALSTLHQTV